MIHAQSPQTMARLQTLFQAAQARVTAGITLAQALDQWQQDMATICSAPLLSHESLNAFPIIGHWLHEIFETIEPVHKWRGELCDEMGRWRDAYIVSSRIPLSSRTIALNSPPHTWARQICTDHLPNMWPGL